MSLLLSPRMLTLLLIPLVIGFSSDLLICGLFSEASPNIALVESLLDADVGIQVLVDACIAPVMKFKD